MGQWKECTIGDIGTVVGGATPSTKKIDNYENGTIAWITPKDLSNLSGRYISHGERNITETGLKSCSAQLMPKNSVLFTSRAPIGYVAIAENEVCTNQGFKSVVPNENTDFLFLYYLLKYNKENIENMGSGTTFKEVSGKTMREIVVKVPENIEEQHKIAEILGTIDDKIEENVKINKNLEQQAQTIYQQMFVDNASSDWAEGTLSDIADITMGQSPSGSSYNEDGNGTIFFQGRAEFGFRFPTVRLYTTEPKRIACANDTLMSVRAPVGDLNVAHTDCCIGRGLAAIHSKNNHQSFVLYTMLSLKKQLDVFNGEGTVFGSINRNSLNEMPLLIPSSKKLDEFEVLVAPIDAAIRNNYDEICRLEQLRDTLLPKLMSGELDVSNIDL
ncbi:restriction endonuclease subunit S [Facklamia hominis]|uniref:restriction endonuclease subunit S n=2 Tax=Facklamia hominis TaxID=178214 RepID=UPI00288C456C|nr:restriction endonuclease subunit S [Facklamia hominis]